MPELIIPDVVFSKPAKEYATLDPLNQSGTSSNGYWHSNGTSTEQDGTYWNQTPFLDANTSGQRVDILTPDTSTFLHADSFGFKAATQAARDEETFEGFFIYRADFKQDEPVILPADPPAEDATFDVEMHVTMRSLASPPVITFPELRYGPEYWQVLRDDDPTPPLTDEWQTFTFNFRRDDLPWQFQPDFPLYFYADLRDAFAAGEVTFGMTFGTGSGGAGQWDIAHMRMGARFDWEVFGTTIDAGDLETRREFGRAS